MSAPRGTESAAPAADPTALVRAVDRAFGALAAAAADEHRFRAVSLPPALRPEGLVGRGGDPFLASYERPEAGLHLVGAGEAGAVVLGPGARPREARAGVRDLLIPACTPLDADAAWLRPRVFAGFAFDPDGSRSGPWRGFGAGLVRLPAVLFVREGERLGAIVAPGVAAETVTALGRELAEVTRAAGPDAEPDAEPNAGPVTPLDVTEDIPRAELARSIAQLAAAVRDGRYEKVVIAGRRTLRGPRPIDLAPSVERLRAGYPACHVFTITCGGSTFLGASPELLVRLDGGAVSSLGLAGSAPRGATAAEDGALGAALLDSAKNRIEHEIVVRALREALAPLTTDLRVPNDPGLRRLPNIQHLATDVAGRARPGVDVLTLLDRLHPTPAVCGWPTAAARGVIADHEPFDRGWYAGPVGWIDAAGDGEFAVALRSALVRGEHAWLFAGAGILGDSQPEAELAEIDLKFRPLATALSGGAPPGAR